MTSARVAGPDSTSASRSDRGRLSGWPPSQMPAKSVRTSATAMGMARTRLMKAASARRNLNAQEAAECEAASKRRDGHAGHQQHDDQEREVDRLRRREQREALRERIDEGDLGDREAEHREHAAHQTHNHPL